jgi:ubiquinone/menaquinone biosynthesis C-methylase UbiE
VRIIRPALDWELALAGQEHLDAAYVAGYDQKASFDPRDDVELLRSRGLNADSTVVDLGAGTGSFAVAVASYCKRVVAVDLSSTMLTALRQKATEQGVANVEALQAGFLSYEHSGAPADVVYTRNALHHLPDFWKAVALSRIAELLRIGGTLRLRDLVYSYEPGEAEVGIARWLEAAAQKSDEGWTRGELEAHLREEHSTFTWLLEPMLGRAGFDIVTADYAPIGAYADYTCTRSAPSSGRTSASFVH